MINKGQKIKILDHGYLALVDYMGSDETIVNAARVSIEGGVRHGKKTTSRDTKLIEKMAKSGHTSPFEHCSITFACKAPIFVFRQWHRHRTQSFNEVSGRYSSNIFKDYYVPTIERLMTEQSDDRQGEGKIDNKNYAMMVAEHIKTNSEECLSIYKALIEGGTSKELARLVMPVNIYSEMYASANLLNWSRFLNLRLEEHAQYEIRVYAMAIYKQLEKLFPESIKAFFPKGV